MNGPRVKENVLTSDLIKERKKDCELVTYTKAETITTKITDSEIHRPGLAFAGFFEKFAWWRIQIIGETEWVYLEEMAPEERVTLLNKYCGYKIPLIIISKNMKPHPELLKAAEKNGIPVVGSRIETAELFSQIYRFLLNYFSPFVMMHASLVDVYGVGLLYIGRPGIGKSECALDLVERGHRLISDDMVKIMRKGERLIGYANNLIKHHVEIRGVGIIDIQKLFGIRAIREEKKIEVVVELTDWDKQTDYERLGLEERTQDILGVEIPKITLPVTPGKNLTVISEVIAMNTLLKLSGVFSVQEFNQNLINHMQNKKPK